MSLQIDPRSEVARARSVESQGIAISSRIGDWRALTRTSRFAYATHFVAADIIFGLTCARDITGEDAGELVTAAATLGVAHPPGNPLWTVLGSTSNVDISMEWVAHRSLRGQMPRLRNWRPASSVQRPASNNDRYCLGALSELRCDQRQAQIVATLQ